MSVVPASAYATTSGGEAKKLALTCGCTRPSKFRLPEMTALATRLPSVTALATGSGSGPLLPMQVVQPNAATLKPSCSRYGSVPDFLRYSVTTFEPGARLVLTYGLTLNPASTAFFANRPAPNITDGL